MAEAQNEPTLAKRKAPQLIPHHFKAGNPGRPKGSRNKLGEDFVAALAEDFAVNGKAAIEAVRADKPDAYLKVIAQVVPKEVHHKVDDHDDLTIDELEQRLIHLLAAGNIAGGDKTRRGDRKAQGTQAIPPALPN